MAKYLKQELPPRLLLVFQPAAKVGKGHTTLERILRVRECSHPRSIDHGVHMARDALRQGNNTRLSGPLLVMTLISRSGVLSPEGNCVKMC